MEQKPGEYARIVVSREEYEQFKSQQARISELEQQVTALREALRLAQHKRFGASSEKTVDDGSQQLSFLFNEAEVIADQEAAQDKQETLVAAHKRHKKHEYTLDNLPDGVATEVVEHRVPQEELECPICGETMQDIGKEVVRKLKIIPAQVIVVEHRYYAYACRNCDQNDIETPVTTAEREKSVIRGSFATAEALAHIMVQKFVMGSPLYRQEQEMKRQGIPLSRQTMSNWILRAAADYLTPVYDALHRELLRREVLHADETTLQVLHEPGKKPQSESYMWLYRTGGLSVADSGNSDASERPIVLYEYQPGRGAKHPTAFLEGFRGYLHTDGYAGYHSLPEEIVVVGCWAHARRKFDEALKECAFSVAPKNTKGAGRYPATRQSHRRPVIQKHASLHWKDNGSRAAAKKAHQYQWLEPRPESYKHDQALRRPPFLFIYAASAFSGYRAPHPDCCR